MLCLFVSPTNTTPHLLILRKDPSLVSMEYRYATRRNYEDFASGRVFYACPGQPAFPVRLASELFQRSYAHWHALGAEGPCVVIYDPTCGGAYWLVALAYLHWDKIEKIIASDIDSDSIEQAERNLSLLTSDGLDRRIAEIHSMLNDFGKASHAEAAQSASRFRDQLAVNQESHRIQVKTFQADSLDMDAIKGGVGDQPIDILLADVPYGQHSEWGGRSLEDRYTPTGEMLQTLIPVLSPGAVLAVVTSKKEKIQHPDYRRLERFQVGKRRIEILTLHQDQR
jgi:hypothetical protein